MRPESIPFEEYLKIQAVHSTLLKSLLTSPRLCLYRMREPLQDNDSLRRGRATHTAILEQHRFLLEYACWTKKDGKVRRGKKWDAFVAANAGRTILTEAQYMLALRMSEAARNDEVLGPYLREPDARKEVTIEWTHKATGLACKTRIDLLASASIDLKTCANPAPWKFALDSARYGYDLQMAIHDDALASIGERRPLKLAAIQSEAPHEVVVFDVSGVSLEKGHARLERALELFAECKASGKWPGISGGEEVPLHLPAWVGTEDEEELELTFGGEAIAV